jgi:hypothetical protein
MTEYCYRLYWCYHGNAGDIVDHRWRYTDSSGLFKEKVWILENKTFELEN